MYEQLIPLGIGAIQSIGGLAGLIKNKKPKDYAITPELKQAYAKSVSNARHGFMPSERQAYLNRLMQTNNQRYRLAATRAGGNMGQSIMAGINYGNDAAMGNLAMQDAQLQRQNQRYSDSLAQQYQNIANMNTGQDWNLWNRKEQAYGGAIQSGLHNMSLSGMNMLYSGDYGKGTPKTKNATANLPSNVEHSGNRTELPVKLPTRTKSLGRRIGLSEYDFMNDILNSRNKYTPYAQ